MYDSLRMQSVQTPIIPVVGELIRANPGTISLGQGVAYYGPPPEAEQYIQKFFADPQNHKYKLVQGIPELLEAIEKKLAAENGIRLGADQRIVVTAGANMGFVNALLAITDPGDEIILNLPYYFNHEMAITMADCKAVCVPTDENYQLQPAAIESAITARTRAVVTISPNNPTGAVYPQESLRQVNDLCRRRRHLSHLRRGLRVLHLRRREALLARGHRGQLASTRSRSFRCRRRTASPVGGSAGW